MTDQRTTVHAVLDEARAMLPKPTLSSRRVACFPAARPCAHCGSVLDFCRFRDSRSRPMKIIVWLCIAFLALGLGSLTPPTAVAQTASAEQRAVLSAFCAKEDIRGLNCLNARGYPNGRPCNVELTGDLYGVSEHQTHFVVAPYTSQCEPHANNWGGSVLLLENNHRLIVKVYAQGIALGNGCLTVSNVTDAENIYCISGWFGQGIGESSLQQYSVQSDGQDSYKLVSGKNIVEATDDQGATGYLSVTCARRINFFNVSNLAHGPMPGTVAVDVTYADAAIIRAACAPGRTPPKGATQAPLEGQAFIDPATAKKARYVYDVQSGEFTTLARFTESPNSWPVQPNAAAAAIVPVTEKRVALVIGNSAYANVPALPNPAGDAQAVADRLRKLGFADVKLVENADENTMLRALGAFAGEAMSADWAVVYFAGHGLVVDGKNFLVPTDATLATDKQVSFEAVSLDQVMNATSGARALRLVILDACRDNPFLRKMVVAGGSRSISRGLAPVEPNAGTMVVYAARDGGLAKDGDGVHSPFTSALLQYLGEPNLELSLLFRKIRDEVLRSTENQQEPNTYGSLPGNEFYFARTQRP